MTFRLKKISPVLQVESIEPVLSFWTERLGFQVTAEVPHGDHMGFVILEKDGYEVMYQTRASVEADASTLAGHPLAGTILFIEVDDIDAIESAVASAEVLVPRRKTFYSATEAFVSEPPGNVVGITQLPS